jgi:hypothetical protein
MTHLLLLGAGFSHNWGAPLAQAVNGSLLRDLHDDPALERALREQPFENALADFFKAGSGAIIAISVFRRPSRRSLIASTNPLASGRSSSAMTAATPSRSSLSASMRYSR